MIILTATERSFLDWVVFLIKNYGDNFLSGALVTLWLALVGTMIGCLIGLSVGMIQKIPLTRRDPLWKKIIVRLGKIICNVYVSIFRFTPMIVQAMVIYYGSAEMFQINMSAFTAGLIVVSVNTGAYMAETVRGGIDSVDYGQTEGALAIGMNHFQNMFYVVMPQTLRNILPQIGNNLVINIKDTSVLNVISVTELFFTTKSIASTYYQYFPPFFISCIIYFVLCLSTTWLLRMLERKIDGPKNYALLNDVNICSQRL